MTEHKRLTKAQLIDQLTAATAGYRRRNNEAIRLNEEIKWLKQLVDRLSKALAHRVGA